MNGRKLAAVRRPEQEPADLGGLGELVFLADGGGGFPPLHQGDFFIRPGTDVGTDQPACWDRKPNLTLAKNVGLERRQAAGPAGIGVEGSFARHRRRVSGSHGLSPLVRDNHNLLPPKPAPATSINL